MPGLPLLVVGPGTASPLKLGFITCEMTVPAEPPGLTELRNVECVMVGKPSASSRGRALSPQLNQKTRCCVCFLPGSFYWEII